MFYRKDVLMKFGRRGFLKGLGSLAAAWMVKPKLPKLEEPPEEEVEEKEENNDVEQTFYDDEKWPVSCGACHMYACMKECPRHATSPYKGFFTYGGTWRSLEEQQDRRRKYASGRRDFPPFPEEWK